MTRRWHGNDGRQAEAIARLWLRLKGWRIQDCRARTPHGELDIIARRGKLLAFIEVKQRRHLEQALLCLQPRQQQRIVRAAMHWLSQHPHASRLHIRFDLIALNHLFLLRHLPDAFRPEEVLRMATSPV